MIETLAYSVNATLDYIGSVGSIFTALILILYLRSRRDD